MRSPNFFLLLFFLLQFSFPLSAQQSPNSIPGNPGIPDLAKAVIKGKVVDALTNAAMEFATVTVFELMDSSLVTGTITNEKGEFFIETKPGRYWAKIEFLAYAPFVVGGIVLTKENPVADLGVLKLQPDATTLSEVEVVAEKSQMQLTLDKKVFNVGKDLANTGGTAEDVLDNVPSVTVDIEGNVSLRGSGNVRILVDGKPSSLIGISNTNGLKQLPANLIDRIEVITNPSARYEAEGMAGIINIVLKKQNRQGFNGSFDFSAGLPETYGLTANLNLRRDRFNFFTSYGLQYRSNDGSGSLFSRFFNGDTTEITQQNSNRDRSGLSHNFRFGADYYFNTKNILTTAFNYRTGDDDNFAKLTYKDYLFNLENPIGSTLRTENEKEDNNNLEYSLSFKKLFDRKGQELNLDMRYDNGNETERSDFVEKYFDPEGSPLAIDNLLQRSTNKEVQRNTRFTADYVHPFNKEGKLEAGALSSFRLIENDYLVEERGDQDWEILTNLSNDFKYDEDIMAAYGIAGNKSGKFSYQAGLRVEYSNVTTELLQTNEINQRDYTDLFPSAHLTYELAGQNALQVSYSRRIRRPRFYDLNPFFTFSDSRNQYSGNPNLDPEYTNSYEVGHIKYWQNASLTSSVYYRYTTDVIERIRIYDNEGNSFTKPENLSTRDRFGLEFTWSYDPMKNLRLNGNFNFFRSITDGEFNDQTFDADTYSWFTRFSSKATLWKKIDAQATFNYRASQETTQGRTKAMYHADLGLSRDILKNNGTLTLSVRDIFNTRKWRYITEGENFFTEGEFQWSSRTVRLTLNYRINQNKQRQKPSGNGGGEFEGGEMF